MRNRQVLLSPSFLYMLMLDLKIFYKPIRENGAIMSESESRSDL